MVQTRDGNGALHEFKDIKEAMDYASHNSHVWKISFPTPYGRVRLVKQHEPHSDSGIQWVYEPIPEDYAK